MAPLKNLRLCVILSLCLLTMLYMGNVGAMPKERKRPATIHEEPEPPYTDGGLPCTNGELPCIKSKSAHPKGELARPKDKLAHLRDELHRIFTPFVEEHTASFCSLCNTENNSAHTSGRAPHADSEIQDNVSAFVHLYSDSIVETTTELLLTHVCEMPGGSAAKAWAVRPKSRVSSISEVSPRTTDLSDTEVPAVSSEDSYVPASEKDTYTPRYTRHCAGGLSLLGALRLYIRNHLGFCCSSTTQGSDTEDSDIEGEYECYRSGDDGESDCASHRHKGRNTGLGGLLYCVLLPIFCNNNTYDVKGNGNNIHGSANSEHSVGGIHKATQWQ